MRDGFAVVYDQLASSFDTVKPLKDRESVWPENRFLLMIYAEDVQ